MTDRRDFIKALGAAALAPALQPLALSLHSRASVRKLDRIGLQLYTVRHQMEKDFDGTIARVAATGYGEVEFAGYFGRNPRDVRALLDHHGLAAPSSHVSLAPAEWRAAPLIRDCCNAFLASFKIWNAATIGGNICMSLPAGPMISLTVALEAIYTLWPHNAPPRQVPAIDFVTGNHGNVLDRGELRRSIQVPASALSRRFAFRRASLTTWGVRPL